MESSIAKGVKVVYDPRKDIASGFFEDNKIILSNKIKGGLPQSTLSIYKNILQANREAARQICDVEYVKSSNVPFLIGIRVFNFRPQEAPAVFKAPLKDITFSPGENSVTAKAGNTVLWEWKVSGSTDLSSFFINSWGAVSLRYAWISFEKFHTLSAEEKTMLFDQQRKVFQEVHRNLYSCPMASTGGLRRALQRSWKHSIEQVQVENTIREQRTEQETNIAVSALLTLVECEIC